MNRIAFVYLWLLSLVFTAAAQERTVNLKIVQTSDVHGNYYPYDFITRTEWEGSLARVHSFVKQERECYKDNLLLFDNGDILQGQPTAYYYNFIDTVSPHLCAEIMNYMGYDAGNMGNHDVETGHAVFDRWVGSCRFPILGANIVDLSTDEPYLPPYKVFEREGVKVVLLGMITPAVPVWLPENLWKGLRFDDMEETARRWMNVIRKKEKPDVVIGLFHAGQREEPPMPGECNENASLQVARNVPGFYVVLMGHDHMRECRKVVNVDGDSVLVMNPANNALVVSAVSIALTLENGKVKTKKIVGSLADMRNYEADEDFMRHFDGQYQAVGNFVSKKIGKAERTISARSAFFGPSSFVDFIHSLQLAISGADISFAAPLSPNAEIKKGDLYVSDMFNLYKYENLLYVMRLSGQEIKDYLEESYYLWTNRMNSPDDHLLWFKEPRGNDSAKRSALQNYSYNFDSAAGIIYTVDVRQPKGKKIHIVGMADGTPFSFTKHYKVALNSYRGNGGGELLTKGAGIPKEELDERRLFSTDKDLRFYLMKYIEKAGVVDPKPLNHWTFIPEEWTLPAANRDREYLYDDGR